MEAKRRKSVGVETVMENSKDRLFSEGEPEPIERGFSWIWLGIFTYLAIAFGFGCGIGVAALYWWTR